MMSSRSENGEVKTATYLTGRYATEVGITDWINPDEGSNLIGRGGLSDEELTPVYDELRHEMEKWMLEIDDPLLKDFY
jgi:hypothetical protein